MSDDLLIVTKDIPFGQAYAYRAGDKITRDAVEANGWQDYVATSSSKTAKAAVTEATAKKES